MPDLVQEVLSDIKTKIIALPEFHKTKVLAYYDGETLLQSIESMVFPAVGVVYEGMSSKGTDGYGKAVDMQFGVYVFPTMQLKDADVLNATDILKLCRNVIIETCAPNNNRYKFSAVIPVDLTDRIAYVQRWTVAGTINPRAV